MPLEKSRKQPIACDKALYRQRHRIAIAFACLKDGRRIATRDYRCPPIFLRAITTPPPPSSGSANEA
jgi:transposase